MKINKISVITLMLLMLLQVNANSQKQGDEILGRYRLPNQLEIEIYRNTEAGGGHRYEGKIVTLNNFEKGQTTDENNPDRGERNKPLLGKVIIKGLQYHPTTSQWTGGTIYASEKGMTVNLNVKSVSDTAAIAEASKLFFSKTVTWKKVNGKQ